MTANVYARYFVVFLCFVDRVDIQVLYPFLENNGKMHFFRCSRSSMPALTLCILPLGLVSLPQLHSPPPLVSSNTDMRYNAETAQGFNDSNREFLHLPLPLFLLLTSERILLVKDTTPPFHSLCSKTGRSETKQKKKKKWCGATLRLLAKSVNTSVLQPAFDPACSTKK